MRYAVREIGPEGRRGYAIADPLTGAFESHQAVDGGTCVPPVELPLAEALALAEAMTQRANAKGAPTPAKVVAARWADDPGPDVPSVWGIEVAPGLCAQCGRKVFANDLDFCHPTHREGDPQRRFVAGCNVHDFGCGHEVFGDSFEEAMSKWNGQSA